MHLNTMSCYFENHETVVRCLVSKSFALLFVCINVKPTQFEKPILKTFCAAYCCHVSDALHVMMKNFENKKIAKKITNCCFQVFYLLHVFSF